MLSQPAARWIGLVLCPFLTAGCFWASLRTVLPIATADRMPVDEYIARWGCGLVLMGVSFGSVAIFFAIIAAGGP